VWRLVRDVSTLEHIAHSQLGVIRSWDHVPLGLNIGNGPGDDDHWLVIIDNMVCRLIIRVFESFEAPTPER
jgi:hypothetical protein